MSGIKHWWSSVAPIGIGVLVILGLTMFLPSKNESYIIYIAGLCGINAILAVSLNIVNGFTGQFSLGHAGFMAVGGYSAAALTVFVGNIYRISGIPVELSDTIIFVSGCILGGAVAALAGLLVGIPSLRLRGDYLAIVTLGFGEIIRVFIENIDAVGGATGMTGIPPAASLFWVFFWVLITIVTAHRILASSHGRALLAVREDEIAAEAMGVDTTGYKVRAFMISSFFAGIAGALLGHYLQLLSPKDFTFVRSIEVVAMVVLGGLGSISGSFLAAVILTVLPEALRPLQNYTGVDFRMVIYSLLLIVLMLTRPQGLFGSREVWTFLPFFRKLKASV